MSTSDPTPPARRSLAGMLARGTGRAMSVTLRWTLRLVATVVIVVVTLLLVMAFKARSMPDLHAWHRDVPSDEFRWWDADDVETLDDYHALEDRLFAQVPALTEDEARELGLSRFVRFVTGSPASPDRFDRDYNRTYELAPDEVRGGALLLHGLSDSPYSLRVIAEMLREQGYHVLSMRMPGHGTIPAGLKRVTWRDWMAAVRLGARHVRDEIGPDRPLCLVGYSNGGALAVRYMADAVLDDELPRPDRVILMSPAIGITKLAVASNWHRIFTWLPYFEKNKWVGIEPEFDPFKYNSFPKNAGTQSWRLARAVQKRLDQVAAAGRQDELPPILAFQSIVDSTVVMPALVTHLFERLEPNGSELVLFDVNMTGDLEGFIRDNHRPLLKGLEQSDALPYRLTVITNEGSGSIAAVARTKPERSAEFTETPLGVEWPPQAFSLSHVAIPFAPDDPLYGTVDDPKAEHLRIGALTLRGERNVLTIPASYLVRLRHNPFHAFMLERMRAAVTPEGDGAG
ncbi:MAG: alpha/beta hydrolase [Planctomycetota bacterium]|jgi:alpha-beta hydrolase superfamily lysophospholipase